MTRHVLNATSLSGVDVQIGPVDLATALNLIDRYLAPNRWAVEFWPNRSLLPLDAATRMLESVNRPRPVPYADLFTDLRRAVAAEHADDDGILSDRAAAIIGKVEAHRPLPMYHGDEECILSECDHPIRDDVCTTLVPHAPICRGCSTVYDSGSEWGPEWISPLRVAWPCTVIEQAVQHYGATMPRVGPDTPARVDDVSTRAHDALRLHLLSAHCNLAAATLSDTEALDQHQHEHDRPGTIRNHDRASLHWDDDRIRAMLAEADNDDRAGYVRATSNIRDRLTTGKDIPGRTATGERGNPDRGEYPDDAEVVCTDGSSTTVGALADLADHLFAEERRQHDNNPGMYHLLTGRPADDCPHCLFPEFGKADS